MQKKIYTLFCLIFAFNPLFSQEIPTNQSLEVWETRTDTDNNYQYVSPKDWNSTNDVLSDFNLSNVEKVTDAAQGSFAAKMMSTGVLGLSTAPGALILGIVDPLNQQIISPLRAYTKRPDSVVVSYKYTPILNPSTNSNDSFRIFAYVSKWDAVKKKRDTLGTANFVSSERISAYKRQAVAFKHINTNIQPDSLLIIISTSWEFNNAPIGSEAFVDNIFLVNKPSSTNDQQNDLRVSLFPNPTSQQLNIKKPSNIHFNTANVQVFEYSTGRLLIQKNWANSTENYLLEISHLTNGMYLLKIQDTETGKYSTQQFIKG